MNLFKLPYIIHQLNNILVLFFGYMFIVTPTNIIFHYERIFITEAFLYSLVCVLILFIDNKNKCPKCKKPLVINNKGWYGPKLSIYCDRCGQNLLHCDIDNPEEKVEKWE